MGRRRVGTSRTGQTVHFLLLVGLILFLQDRDAEAAPDHVPLMRMEPRCHSHRASGTVRSDVLLFGVSIDDAAAQPHAQRRRGMLPPPAAGVLGRRALDLVVASVIALTGLLLSTDVGSLLFLWVLESCLQW